jgi:GDP-L-fucose synthase
MPILDHFIMHDPIEKSFNITPNQSIGLLNIAEIVKTISKKNIDIKVAQDGLGLEYSGDNSLLHHEINGLEFTPIEKSIDDLFNWYTTNKSNLKFDLLLTDK